MSNITYISSKPKAHNVKYHLFSLKPKAHDVTYIASNPKNITYIYSSKPKAHDVTYSRPKAHDVITGIVRFLDFELKKVLPPPP